MSYSSVHAYLSIIFARLMAFDLDCFIADRREVTVLSFVSFLLNFSCIRFTLLGRPDRPAKVFSCTDVSSPFLYSLLLYYW